MHGARDMGDGDVITLKVTGLRPGLLEQQVRDAFTPHGYVREVVLLDEEGSAIVRYGTRTALEAVGDAIAAFSKEQPHACAQTSAGLTVKLKQDSGAAAAGPALVGSQLSGSSPQQQQQQQPMMQPPQGMYGQYGAYGMPPFGPGQSMQHGMGMPYDPSMWAALAARAP